MADLGLFLAVGAAVTAYAIYASQQNSALQYTFNDPFSKKRSLVQVKKQQDAMNKCKRWGGAYCARYMQLHDAETAWSLPERLRPDRQFF
jgi:hypothetical protein